MTPSLSIATTAGPSRNGFSQRNPTPGSGWHSYPGSSTSSDEDGPDRGIADTGGGDVVGAAAGDAPVTERSANDAGCITVTSSAAVPATDNTERVVSPN